eukprot:m.794819 g.794819  ORF g.794819 m.794819 type:complete len:60 (+) comp23341_c0_seq5:2461-2640(+)
MHHAETILDGRLPSKASFVASMLHGAADMSITRVASGTSVFIAGRRPDRSVQDHPHRLI